MTDTPTPYSVVMLYFGPDKSTPLKAPWKDETGQHFTREGARAHAAHHKRYSTAGNGPMCVVNVYPKPAPIPPATPYTVPDPADEYPEWYDTYRFGERD